MVISAWVNLVPFNIQHYYKIASPYSKQVLFLLLAFIFSNKTLSNAMVFKFGGIMTPKHNT